MMFAFFYFWFPVSFWISNECRSIIVIGEKIGRGFSVTITSMGSPTDETSPMMFGQRNFDHLIFLAPDAQCKFSLKRMSINFELGDDVFFGS
jgi:hypothetical protein